MKKLFSILLRFVIGITILVFLLYKLDFREVYYALLSVNLYAILLVFLYVSILVFINTLILKMLLTHSNVKINFLTLLKHYSKAWSLGHFLPGRLGEFSLIYFLKKENVPYGKGASITIISKLTTFITLVVIGIFGFFLFLSKAQAATLTLLFLGLIIITCFLLFSSKTRSIIKRYVLRKYASKFKGFSKNLLYFVKEKKKILLVNFLLNFIRVILNALIIWILLLFFGAKIPIIMAVIINSLGFLVTLIPISIAGLGTKELAVVYLYSQLGVGAVIAGSVYLLIRIISYLIAGGILVFSKTK